MPTKIRLAVEPLEPRETPHSAGLPWVNPLHLTLSFAPDGTAVGPALSDLTATLDEHQAWGWRLEILRAFQTWAIHANLNVGLVEDSGLPLGTPGLVQGDDRFGDIRVGAVPLGGSQVANATPFRATGGTWSGDVLINSGLDFGTADSQGYDLFSVVLHEAGHALGLGESDDPLSAMYHRYLGPKAGLAAADVAALRAHYGARQPDAFDGKPNDTLKSASSLSSFSDPAAGDITTLNDVDYYTFTAPSGKDAPDVVEVRVRTSGLSLLAASLTVYDGSGNQIGTAAGAPGEDLSVTVPKLKPGGVYFARVGNATQSVFGVGAYRLSFSAPGLPTSPVTLDGEFYADRRQNDTLKTATKLKQNNAGDTPLTFGFAAELSGPTDVDYYSVRSTMFNGGERVGMVVMVSASARGGLAPQVEVFDKAGQAAPVEVVANEDGFFSVEVLDALPNSDYYLKVTSLAPAGSPRATGGYFLGVDFAPDGGVALEVVSAGTLSPSGSPLAQGLAVTRSGSFHFVLSAATEVGASAQVQMLVYDAAGTLVYRLTALADQPAGSGVAYLAAGNYTVVFQAVSKGTATPVTYTLKSAAISDPIGPVLVGSGTTTTTTTPPTDYYWTGPSYLVFDPMYSWIDPYYYY